MAKTGLGKGLSALIPSMSVSEEEGVVEIEVDAIRPNPHQPRQEFAVEKLNELAASLQEHGVVQPIVVRKIADEYELVVGERRWRASKLLGWKKIPAVVKEYTDQQIMEIALVENLQREDLNPIEEALAYQRLITEFAYTQEEVARKVSKSRPFVANMVRILSLPEEILELVARGKLTVGHARPLLALSGRKQQLAVAAEIISDELTVRDVEALVRELSGQKKQVRSSRKKTSRVLSPEIESLEARLREKYATKVSIKPGKKAGKIEIEYYDLADLNRLLDILL